MKCGIIGLPNAGKSTLFKALTSIQVPAENYPFCTIEPNKGIVKIPDTRIQKLAHFFQPEKTIYPVIEFVDIAGLIKGAHKGEGLGHKFLSHIRESHALVHVVRCFEQKNITHVLSSIDPCRDIDVVEEELLLSDLSIVQKRLEKVEKLSKSNKIFEQEFSLLKKLLSFINNGNKVSQFESSTEEKDTVHLMHLLTSKPMMYMCNIAENQKDLSFVEKVKEKVGEERVIVLSGQLESDLSSLPEDEQEEFLKTFNLNKSALDRFIQKSFSLLNLITFFTAGKQEVKGWTIKQGSLAPVAAGVIHSDFQKGFIKAEVYSVKDLFPLQSLQNVKEKGLYRIEGKDYIFKDGDVALFRFNV